VASHCSRVVVVVSLPDTVGDLGDSLDIHLLADENHISHRASALAGHGVTAFNTFMKTVSFSRHAVLSGVGLSLAFSSVTGHYASLLGLFLDLAELGLGLGFLSIPNSLVY